MLSQHQQLPLQQTKVSVQHFLKSRQTLTYNQSRYAGDVNGGAAYESNAGCSPFRIALGL